MKKHVLSPVSIIGIAVRTANAPGSAEVDIPALWQRFREEGIMTKIPGIISSDKVYSIYTDYEGDHTLPYTTVIGCEVASLEYIPEGMHGLTLAAGNYQQFSVTGNLFEGLVFNAWLNIWDSGLPRVYTTDFEVYGPAAQNPEYATVDIYVAVV